MFFHYRSRSQEFLGMIGNGFFSFPSCSRILGIDFFIPFPFPNFRNGFFSFPSRSRILGMCFFHSLPVPEFREWNYPFPFLFPNDQKSFPLTPGLGKSLGQYPNWYLSVWNPTLCCYPLQVRGRTIGGSLRESSYTVEIETLSKPLPKSTLDKSSHRYKLITPKTVVMAYWGY